MSARNECLNPSFSRNALCAHVVSRLMPKTFAPFASKAEKSSRMAHSSLVQIGEKSAG